jgi:hypothetical protein
MVLTDHEGIPCKTSIKAPLHLNEAETVSRHIWMSNLELQDLNNYHTKDLLLCALAHLWDDNHAKLLEVEKTLSTVKDEAWKEYEATNTPLSPAQWSTLPAVLSCMPSNCATFTSLIELARSPDSDSNSFQRGAPYTLLTP